MIIIHYDFTNGKEVSYIEGLDLFIRGINFYTNVLDFFSADYPNTIILNRNGEYISVKELLANTGEYTNKEIRSTHNLRKMLITGSFTWKPVTFSFINSIVNNMTITCSIEKLYHFICSECNKWFTIGDWAIKNSLICPHCGVESTVEIKDIDIPITEKDIDFNNLDATEKQKLAILLLHGTDEQKKEAISVISTNT